MGYMNFQDPTLEAIFRMFKWARNNSIQIFEEAQKHHILDYTSRAEKNSSYTFQPLLFQFQCIVTTTDTFYRKLTHHKNQAFGVLQNGEMTLSKNEIGEEDIKKILQRQLDELENLYKDFDDKKTEENIEHILSISNHEYLHQGQMIIDFREAGVELPDRYKKAWAL